MGKKIIFSIFNDTNYDQRMIRICSSLAEAGYDVLLVGRRPHNAIPLIPQTFPQKRLRTPFSGGWLHYAVFNLQLFFFLLFKKADVIVAIDLDTILPVYLVSSLRRIPRVYDAHELFCEMKEIVTRPRVYKAWKRIEKMTVPHFTYGYTVNSIIAGEFEKMYGVQYEVIRSISVLEDRPLQKNAPPFIIYQGAVNEGRSFETLIPAMQWVNAPLVIYGNGNFMQKAREMVEQLGLKQKVIFKGQVPPAELKSITGTAAIGITLFDDTGISNYYSLSNRFFDYIHAGIPQLCSDYPAYREINNLYGIAVLVKDLSAQNIARQLNELLSDKDLYNRLAANCGAAKQALNWQQEAGKLIAFYKKIVS